MNTMSNNKGNNTNGCISRRQFLRGSCVAAGMAGLLTGRVATGGTKANTAPNSPAKTVEATTAKEAAGAAGAGEGGSSSQDGGGDGSSDGGDSGDGEPPTAAIIPTSMEWWQVSLLIALCATLASFLVFVSCFPPNRFLLPCSVLSFTGTFVVTMYLNPQLRFLRLSVAAVSALIVLNTFGGMVLLVPLPWTSIPVLVQFSGPDWSGNVMLGLNAALFGVLYYFMKQIRRK